MRASAHHVTKSSRTAHVEFTSSSRYVQELVHVAVWPCLLTHTVKCTSRIDVTCCSRLVYAPHEQFVHNTSSSRRVHEQLMRRSQLLSDSCNHVGAAHQTLYVGTTSKFSLEQRHDVTLFQHRVCHAQTVREVRRLVMNSSLHQCVKYTWPYEWEGTATLRRAPIREHVMIYSWTRRELFGNYLWHSWHSAHWHA